MTFLGTLLLTAAPLRARADIPPANACTTEGAACQTAGPANDQPGSCQKTTCQKPTSNGTVSYDCMLCLATGTGGQGGSVTATGGASATGGSKGSSSDGCAVGGIVSPGTDGLAGLVGGALLLLLARRRRA